MKIVLQIFWTIYRFVEKLSILIVIIYLLAFPLLSRIYSLIEDVINYQYKSIQLKDHQQSIFSFLPFIQFTLFILYHFGTNYDVLKNNYFETYHFINEKLCYQSIVLPCVFFFVDHQKLDELFHIYAIM
ncbi:unnamed protein product [Paramecium primaurelia]|uniref:Uncharacterized protein n=1 Tax=Paramecium primaurelia TaxID=5886 RepID=A0A8S1MU87_PARPR|nr:unnamed protein product [Paramecium primaurelia]